MTTYEYCVYDNKRKIDNKCFDNFEDAYDYAQTGLDTYIEEIPVLYIGSSREDEGDGVVIWTSADDRPRDEVIKDNALRLLTDDYKKAALGDNADFFDQEFDEGVEVSNYSRSAATHDFDGYFPAEEDAEFEYISDFSNAALDRDDVYVGPGDQIGSAAEWLKELTLREIPAGDPDFIKYAEILANQYGYKSAEDYLADDKDTGKLLKIILIDSTDSANPVPSAIYERYNEPEENAEEVIQFCPQIRQLKNNFDEIEERALDDYKTPSFDEHSDQSFGEALTEGSLLQKTANALTTPAQKISKMYSEFTVIPFDASGNRKAEVKLNNFKDAVSKAKSFAAQNSKVWLKGSKTQPQFNGMTIQDMPLEGQILQLYKDSVLQQDAVKLFADFYNDVSPDLARKSTQKANTTIKDSDNIKQPTDNGSNNSAEVKADTQAAATPAATPTVETPAPATPANAEATKAEAPTSQSTKIIDLETGAEVGSAINTKLKRLQAKLDNIKWPEDVNASKIDKIALRKLVFGESLEPTVDQDLTDNRTPVVDDGVELAEPVDANEIRAHEQGVKLEALDDNAIKDCKVNKVIAHSEDEKPVCDVERPLDKPLTDDPDITKDFYEDISDEEFFEAFGAALKDKHDREVDAEEKERNFHFGYEPQRGSDFDAFDDFDTEIQSDELASIADQQLINRKINNFVSNLTEEFDFSKKYDPENPEPFDQESEQFLWDNCYFLNTDGETYVNTEAKAKAVVDYIPMFLITDSKGVRKKVAKSTGALFDKRKLQPVKYEKTGENEFRVFVD